MVGIIKLKRIILIIVAISLLLLKPTYFGANFTFLGLLSLTISIFVLRKSVIVAKRITIICMLVFLYYFYMTTNELIQVGNFRLDNVKAMTTIVITVIIFNGIIVDRGLRIKLVRSIILFLCFWSCMYLLSLPFMLIVKDSQFDLKIVEIVIKRYQYHMQFFFPFLSAAGEIPFAGHYFLRMNALFRECGIAQLFYIWAFAESEYYFKDKILFKLKVLLFLGVVFCLSTAGYICFAAYWCFVLIFSIKNRISKRNLKKIMITIMVLMLAAYAVLYLPVLGFRNKIAVSKVARMGSYPEVFHYLSDNALFGSYNHTLSVGGNCFLHILYMTGLFGAFLYLSIITYACISCKDVKRYILANVACILTLLFSQPIFDAPLIFLLLSGYYDASIK